MSDGSIVLACDEMTMLSGEPKHAKPHFHLPLFRVYYKQLHASSNRLHAEWIYGLHVQNDMA